MTRPAGPASTGRLGRPLRFLFAGGLATAIACVSFPVLYALLPGQQLHAAFILASAINVTSSFQLQRSIAFRSRAPWWPEYGRFVVGALTIVAIGWALLALLMRGVGLGAPLANALVVAFSATSSYLLHSRITFRDARQAPWVSSTPQPVGESMQSHVLFDLDGTLIDSSRSILEGFVAALAAHGATPVVPVDSRLIGPPLPEALRILSGESDPTRLAAIARSFTDYYDNEGFKASDAYAGVGEMLLALKAAGATLHIATNKRFEPTRRIVDWLGWADLFDQVYAIDKLPGARFANKAAMIAHLMQTASVPVASAHYVGDRDEDCVAATANALPFVLVTWGYGDYADLAPYPRVARSPAQLPSLLLA